MRRALLAAILAVSLTAAGAAQAKPLYTSWDQIAAESTFPVYQPQQTLGLPLTSLNSGPCGNIAVVSARYGVASRGRWVGVTEFHPEVCGNGDEGTVVTHATINGLHAVVVVNCVDCRGITVKDGFKRGWQLLMGTQRVSFEIGAHHISYGDLLRFARSLKRVTLNRPTVHLINFQSPDHQTFCTIDPTGSAGCGRKKPNVSGYIAHDGTVTLCVNASYTCLDNTDPEEPILAVGQGSELAGFRCDSETDGMTCTRTSGPERGHGFLISPTAVTEISP